MQLFKLELSDSLLGGILRHSFPSMGVGFERVPYMWISGSAFLNLSVNVLNENLLTFQTLKDCFSLAWRRVIGLSSEPMFARMASLRQ